MNTPTRRKYLPLTVVAKPVTCFLCAATARNETELQAHMNATHPGWLDIAVRKILGTARSEHAHEHETTVQR